MLSKNCFVFSNLVKLSSNSRSLVSTRRTFAVSKTFDVSKRILYEDKHIIVISKPADMLTQGDFTKESNLLDLTKEYIKKTYNKTGNVYLGMVHRLDKQVSGTIVFAKTDRAAARINLSFQEQEVTKKYMAMVQGELEGGGECHNLLETDAPLQTPRVHKTNKGGSNNQGIDNVNVKEARLKYKSLFTINTGTVDKSRLSSLVDVQLETGRKHQIRAQLAHMGHPIVSDQLYGYRNVSVSSVKSIPDPKLYKSYDYDEVEFEEFSRKNRHRNVTDIRTEKPTTLIRLLQDSAKDQITTKEQIRVSVPLLNIVQYHNHDHSYTNQNTSNIVELTRQNTPEQTTANHKKFNKINSIYLHAYYLSFPHPFTKEIVSFQDIIPDSWGREYDTSVLNVINTQIKQSVERENETLIERNAKIKRIAAFNASGILTNEDYESVF